MQTGRLGGVAVLAVAVLVLAVGSALGRPDVVGVASAPPIDPPPQVGDCLYAGSEGPWGVVGPDGNYRENPYAHWFSTCGAPWYGEVVAVRSRADILAGLAASAYRPGPDDQCAAGAAAYLGRPDVADPAEHWAAFGTWTTTLMPNQRQYAAGQMWEACVMTPPSWAADGTLVLHGDVQSDARITESVRGAWVDPTFRDRVGSCRDDRSGPDAVSVFCGSIHGSEVLAWTSWPDPSWASDAGDRPDAATLLATCADQASRMLQRRDSTAGGALTVDVWLANGGGYLDIAPGVDLPEDGSAECSVHPAASDRLLTATLVGIGEGPVPLTSG